MSLAPGARARFHLAPAAARSVAMLAISGELGWAEGVQGLVQSGFLWGYLATQLLGGALADKYGGERVAA